MRISKLLRETKEKIAGGEVGFTLVELLVVMIIGTIMLAGMVGLIAMGFQSFTQGHDLESITDASRRVLPAMDRQIKPLLHINDSKCASYLVSSGVWNGISFYSNISNDTNATVDTYSDAEKVVFYLDATKHAIMQQTTPGGSATPGAATTLCSYVTSFRIYYFAPGIVPGSETPPANRYTGTNLNASAGSVEIVIQLQQGAVSRTFEQTTFLRVLKRS